MNYRVFLDVFIHPKSAFLEIHENPNDYFFVGIGILITYSVLTNVFDLSTMVGEAMLGKMKFDAFDLFFRIELSIFSGVLIIAFTYWLAKRFFKIKTSFRSLFANMEFAILPFMIISVPCSIWLVGPISDITEVPSLTASPQVLGLLIVVFLPLGIWSVILSVLACKQSLQLKTLDTVVVMISAGVITGIIVWVIDYVGDVSDFTI